MGPNPPHGSSEPLCLRATPDTPGAIRRGCFQLSAVISGKAKQRNSLSLTFCTNSGPLESLLAADPPPLQRGHPSAGVLVIQMSFVKQLHCAKSCLCLVSCPRFAETEVFLSVIDGNDVCSPSAGAASHVLAIRR